MIKVYENRSLVYVTLISGFVLVLFKWEDLREGPVPILQVFLLSYLSAFIVGCLLFIPWNWVFSKINLIRKKPLRWPVKVIVGVTAFFIFNFNDFCICWT